jgi:hypothetical protein
MKARRLPNERRAWRSLSRDLHQEAQPVAKGQPEGPSVQQAGESPDAAFGEVP